MKRTSESDDNSSLESNQKRKANNYSKQFVDTESSDIRKKRPKYVVRSPFHEDRNSYNLESCIRDRRKPNFGYALPDLNLPTQQEDLNGLDFEFMRPSVVAMRREKQFIQHVLKCFTFGKPVRRDNPLVYDSVSRIDEIRSKFNRVRLIRRYFSIKRRDLNRKFDYPID